LGFQGVEPGDTAGIWCRGPSERINSRVRAQQQTADTLVRLEFDGDCDTRSLIVADENVHRE